MSKNYYPYAVRFGAEPPVWLTRRACRTHLELLTAEERLAEFDARPDDFLMGRVMPEGERAAFVDLASDLYSKKADRDVPRAYEDPARREEFLALLRMEFPRRRLIILEGGLPFRVTGLNSDARRALLARRPERTRFVVSYA